MVVVPRIDVSEMSGRRLFITLVSREQSPRQESQKGQKDTMPSGEGSLEVYPVGAGKPEKGRMPGARERREGGMGTRNRQNTL